MLLPPNSVVLVIRLWCYQPLVSQRVTLIVPFYSFLSATERVATQAFYEELLGNLQQITAVEQLATFIKIT